MLHSSLCYFQISLSILLLHTLCAFGFKAMSNHGRDDNGASLMKKPFTCENNIVSSMCSRCVEFVQSMDVMQCCESLEQQHQCLKVLNQVDKVEALLPAGLDGEVDGDGQEPSGLDLLLQNPESYGEWYSRYKLRTPYK